MASGLTDVLPGGDPADPYGYKAQVGYYRDAEKGLYLCTSRYYGPQAGRWVTEDPIGYAGGVNVYAYCGNDPWGVADPLGLCGGGIWGWLSYQGKSAGAWYVDGMGGFSFWVDEQFMGGQTGVLGDTYGRWEGGTASGWEVLVEAAKWGYNAYDLATGAKGALMKQGAKRVGREVLEGFAKYDGPMGYVNIFAGRAGGQSELKDLLHDPKVSSRDRGWIRQDLNQIERGKRNTVRVPPGKNLAHGRGKRAAQGYSYRDSNLQDVDLHKLEHRHEGY